MTKVTEKILAVGDEVKTSNSETGTIESKHLTIDGAWNVVINNSEDTQNPPRWIGNIVEYYWPEELTKI